MNLIRGVRDKMTKRERRKCDRCGMRRVGFEVGNAKYFPTVESGRYWICDKCANQKTNFGQHGKKRFGVI